MAYHHYDYMLVLLSYIVSVLGSFTALKLTANMALARDARQRRRSLVLASLVMGVGAVWAMHFIAMLACTMPVPMTYSLGLTTLSAVVAVLACLIGFSITGRGEYTLVTLVSAGTYMGLGVAAMHYLGMAAMQMSAVTVYDGATAALSVLIAIVASVAALWMAFRRRSTVQTVIGALIMGAAVCGMHYTGMAAARFVTNGVPVAPIDNSMSSALVGTIIFAIVFSVLIAVLVAVLRGQRRLVQQHA